MFQFNQVVQLLDSIEYLVSPCVLQRSFKLHKFKLKGFTFIRFD